jgi:hypothetical protein
MDPALKSTSHAAAIVVFSGKEQAAGEGETLFRCRPYEFGWLLHAFAQPGSTAIKTLHYDCLRD